MKKLIAFVLAAVLLLALVPMAGAAFTDADKIAENKKIAVDYVSEKKIISGFPDGSFKPQDQLTRAQAAKILCAALEGADKADALTKTDTGFSDVPASHWAAKYIAYCVDKSIVAGVGGGKFNPDAPLSALAFAKMTLVAYEQEKAEKLTGAQWAVNTQKTLKAKGFNWYVDSIADSPTTRENACQLFYNISVYAEDLKVEPEAYKETTITFNDASKYKLLGRAWQDANGVVCDWSADGVEFTLDCKGPMTLSASCDFVPSTHLELRVIVDGVPGDQIPLTAKGSRTVLAYINIRPGVHTIRIIKDSVVSPSKDMLLSVKLNCKPETMKPTAVKQKFIEIIGDSTSSGAGAVPTNTPETTKNSVSMYLAYGNIIAEELGMDYEMLVKGSMGLLYRTGKPNPFNYMDMYEYQNRYRDAYNKVDPQKYSFPRKADLVCIKIGGNDGNKSTEEEWYNAMKEFLTTIRGYHGQDVPIIIVWYGGKDNYARAAARIIEEDPKVHVVTLKPNAGGMGNHPSAEAQKGFAKLIMDKMHELGF